MRASRGNPGQARAPGPDHWARSPTARSATSSNIIMKSALDAGFCLHGPCKQQRAILGDLRLGRSRALASCKQQRSSLERSSAWRVGWRRCLGSLNNWQWPLPYGRNEWLVPQQRAYPLFFVLLAVQGGLGSEKSPLARLLACRCKEKGSSVVSHRVRPPGQVRCESCGAVFGRIRINIILLARIQQPRRFAPIRPHETPSHISAPTRSSLSFRRRPRLLRASSKFGFRSMAFRYSCSALETSPLFSSSSPRLLWG